MAESEQSRHACLIIEYLQLTQLSRMKPYNNTPSKLFGISCPPKDASIIVIPVPWEVTVSARSGTSLGPESILKASYQLNMLQHEYPEAQKMGISMLPIPHELKRLSDTLRHHTVGYIHAMESGFEKSTLKQSIVNKIDHYAYELKEDVKAKALKHLRNGKMVAVLGGDHSTPLGLIEALSEPYNNMAILQIDAHPGMRKAYRGFQYSHASVMYNALQMAHVARVVQVGIRQYSKEEANAYKQQEGRVFPFFDNDLKRQRLRGATWADICASIVDLLPERVYVSFDIDGLNVKLCPSTGTPVPGGLEFEEVCFLFEAIVRAGKKIVGFDLCEVAPGENMDWDAQVGSWLLYKLCMMMGASQGKISLAPEDV